MPEFELNGVFIRSAGLDGPGPDPSPGPPPAPAPPPSLQGAPWAAQSRPGGEIVLDDPNFLPFDFLREGDRVGRAVVKIQRADGAVGTAFLVAPDILLTNHHVLPDAETASTAYALANYERRPVDEPAGRPTVARLDPGELFLTNAELDFTFCGVVGVGHLGALAPDRDSHAIGPGDYVNIIQHPRGRPKEVALQDNLVVRADPLVLQYSCDTEPGSSGSPVFNNQWDLVALHHASVVADAPAGRRAGVGAGVEPGLRYLNEGVRLSAIAIWLEAFEPEAPEARRQVERVRAVFGGVDPQVGYFGALGRKARGRPASRLVADCYRAETEDLDLAFWDARALDGLRRDRLDELGRAVAAMGMDVWVLGHADAGQVDALCEHLETCHRLDFGRVHERARGRSPAVSVLYRRSPALALEAVDRGEDGPGVAGGTGAGAGAGDGPRAPIRLRFRCRSRRGGDRVVGLAAMPGPAAVPPGGVPGPAVPAPDDGPEADAWVLIGPSPALRGPGGPDLAGRSLLVAEAPEGAVAVALAAGTAVERVFLSSDLAPVLGDPAVLERAAGRPMPGGFGAPGSPRPIALRLTWRAPEAEPGRPGREAGPAAAPEAVAIPEDVLERALRGVLDRMLAEGRLRLPP